MARTLNAGMTTAVAATEGYANVWLLAITSSGGTTRICDKPQDVLYSGNTYSGVGGSFELDVPFETNDPAAQSLRISLSGVSQTLITDLLSNNMRGYSCTLYFGSVLLSTGVVADAPIEVFTGYLNERWTVEETPGHQAPGTVKVNTTVVSDIARYLFPRSCRTNVTSHNDMLQRGGLTTGDTFFSRVPELVGKLVTWGKRTAQLKGGTGGSGGFVNDTDHDTIIVDRD